MIKKSDVFFNFERYSLPNACKPIDVINYAVIENQLTVFHFINAVFRFYCLLSTLHQLNKSDNVQHSDFTQIKMKKQFTFHTNNSLFFKFLSFIYFAFMKVRSDFETEQKLNTQMNWMFRFGEDQLKKQEEKQEGTTEN